MIDKETLTGLTRQVDHFYEKYSAKRVALAAVIVGLSSILSAFATYVLTFNGFLTTAVFAVSSVLIINMVMFMIVPPTQLLNDSKVFILGAVKDPMRIQAIEGKKVKLEDQAGDARFLTAIEQTVWETIITPHFMRMTSNAKGTDNRKRGQARSLAERKVMEKEQAALRIKEKEVQAASEKLDADRQALEVRERELKVAEDLAIAHLSNVEVAEAELAQLEANVDRQALEIRESEEDGDPEALRADELKLVEKEAEIQRLKSSLEEDRRIVEKQKAQLQQVQEDLLRDNEMVTLSKSEKERVLEQRERKLKESFNELEDRSRFVCDVENSLVERLNALSEREASVEQSEINSGLTDD